MNSIKTKLEHGGTAIRSLIRSFFPDGSSRGFKPAIRFLPPARAPKTRILLLLVILAVILSGVESGRAANSLPVESKDLASKLGQKSTAGQPGSSKSVSDSVPAASSAQAAAPTRPAGWWPPADSLNILLLSALLIIGILLLRKLIPVVTDYLSPQLQLLGFVQAPLSEAWPKSLAEDEDIAKFVGGFRAAPGSAPVTLAEPSSPVNCRIPDEAVKEDKKTDRDALKEFFAWAPGQVMDLHYLYNEIGRSMRGVLNNKAIMREKVGNLAIQIRALKNRASLPELVPVSEMASALDGLLKQLMDRADALNHSTLRTVAGGIDVLGDLCAPELRVDIATNPPIRILVVDDDSVSRFALSASIKKVFNPPDFAENGEAALALVARQAYDLVFLDVKMPGMDGFEVCSRIRESDLNRSTPVVFVTGLKDFESQTTSIVSGGNDLIGKPFLTFEIAVKALTLALHNRLKLRAGLVEDANAPVKSETVPPGVIVPPVAVQSGDHQAPTRPEVPLRFCRRKLLPM